MGITEALQREQAERSTGQGWYDTQPPVSADQVIRDLRAAGIGSRAAQSLVTR